MNAPAQEALARGYQHTKPPRHSRPNVVPEGTYRYLGNRLQTQAARPRVPDETYFDNRSHTNESRYLPPVRIDNSRSCLHLTI